MRSVDRNNELRSGHDRHPQGQDELDAKSINVRNRDDVGSKARSHIIPLAEVAEKMVALKQARSLEKEISSYHHDLAGSSALFSHCCLAQLNDIALPLCAALIGTPIKEKKGKGKSTKKPYVCISLV